jgi:epoxyqueuosine reductase
VEEMVAGLLDVIRTNGAQAAVVPFTRVADLKSDMHELISGDFQTSWLKRMANHMINDANKFIPADISFEPCSLISVVIPSPKVLLQFHHEGKPALCVLPPHYADWNKNNMRVLQCIIDYLEPSEYTAEIAPTITQKLLAAHCGLGRYGRNNIFYNDEFGSYIQIMTYVSDLPCAEAAWYPVRRMELCEKCCACVIACPTGAIDIERRLVNSDRCITFANESPGEFPDWLDEDAHNSITGCAKCQDCCPANKRNMDNTKMGTKFTKKKPWS